MVTLRTLLLFNLAAAALFALSGMATHLRPDARARQLSHLPNFDNASRQALAEAENVEALVPKALFYFDVAKGLKLRQYDQDDDYVAVVRLLSYLSALALALSAALACLLWRSRPARPRQ